VRSPSDTSLGALGLGILGQLEGSFEGARDALDAQEASALGLRDAALAAHGHDAAGDLHGELRRIGARDLVHEAEDLAVVHDVEGRQHRRRLVLSGA
jgi:hypothetical protein